jgi:hypothetical protein
LHFANRDFNVEHSLKFVLVRPDVAHHRAGIPVDQAASSIKLYFTLLASPEALSVINA